MSNEPIESNFQHVEPLE